MADDWWQGTRPLPLKDTAARALLKLVDDALSNGPPPRGFPSSVIIDFSPGQRKALRGVLDELMKLTGIEGPPEGDIKYFVRNNDSEDLEISKNAFDAMFPPGAGTKDYIRTGPGEVVVTLYHTRDVVGVMKSSAPPEYWDNFD